MLSNCDDIIRQHKAACLRVTSLLACKDLIWVGTSAGVLLTISGQNVYKTGTAPQVTGIPHGHTGHVRFLTFVETDTFDKSDKKFPANRNSSTAHHKSKSETANILVISGGDGYEDFRGIGNNPMGEIAGREDSTNHLLLWQV
jgi:Rho guanine nucleotide exchange factor 17